MDMELFLLDEDIKLAEGYAAMAAAETESAPLRRQRRERRQQIGNTTPQKGTPFNGMGATKCFPQRENNSPGRRYRAYNRPAATAAQ